MKPEVVDTVNSSDLVLPAATDRGSSDELSPFRSPRFQRNGVERLQGEKLAELKRLVSQVYVEHSILRPECIDSWFSLALGDSERSAHELVSFGILEDRTYRLLSTLSIALPDQEDLMAKILFESQISELENCGPVFEMTMLASVSSNGYMAPLDHLIELFEAALHWCRENGGAPEGSLVMIVSDEHADSYQSLIPRIESLAGPVKHSDPNFNPVNCNLMRVPLDDETYESIAAKIKRLIG